MTARKYHIKRGIRVLLLLLIGAAVAYPAKAQDILANPEFNDLVKCCEYRIYHANGWYYVGAFDHRQKIDGKGFIKLLCYNDTNRFYGITTGSLIKPVRSGRPYLLKIKLKSKSTFYLHYGFVQQRTFKNDADTGAFTDVPFKRMLVNNKRTIQVSITPEVDSCNYIVFKFEDVENLFGQYMRLVIDRVELIDPAENKKTLPQKSFVRIREIYDQNRWHDFTIPCERNRTLIRK